MTEPRSDAGVDRAEPGAGGWSRERFGPALLAIAVIGLIGRVAYVLCMRHHHIGVDGIGYHGRALAVATGHGFINPLVQAVFHTPKPIPDATDPPGWIVVLAAATKLGLRSVLSQQLFACVIGSATIVMSGLAGRAAFGPRAGLIGAGVVAAYPNVWLYERELMAETLALFGVATCIWLAYRFSRRPSTRLAIALGAVTGALTMTRSEEILILPFIVLPLILLARKVAWRRRVGWLALAGIACLVVIAPWSAYNTARFNRPVALSNGLGQALLTGNCDLTYHGELLGYYSVGIGSGCNVLLVHPSSNQAIRDGQARHVAIKFMSGHLSRLPIVMAARVGRTFNGFRPFQQVHLEATRSTSVNVIRGALFSYWLLLPFAGFGVVVARRRRIPIFPMLAFPVIVVLAVVFTIGAVRYRAPAEIPLALCAGLAIDAVTHRPRHVRKGRRPASA